MPKDITRLLRLHDASTAAFRAELLQRSAGEVLFDDYLLAQMKRGKPFKVALRKANAKYPSEALNPSGADLAGVEEHYNYFFRMRELDWHCEQLRKTQSKIEETDRKIAEIVEQMTTPLPEPPETSGKSGG